MIIQNTEKSLGIFWDGEEVDGITVYGFFKDINVDQPTMPKDIWGDNCEVKSSKLFGEDWTVWVWDIRIVRWPTQAEWIKTIERTLKGMLRQGAIVSWAGLEGFFVDPPDLFDPEFMSGGVWALYSEPEGFFCPAEIGKQFKAVDDSILKKIKDKIEFE
jgi:hypothetical protein